jgi:hypothetical protein
MTDDRPLAFTLPAVSRKKVTAAFDGGRLSSDSGVMLLGLAERRRGLAPDREAALPARSSIDVGDPSSIPMTESEGVPWPAGAV